jgi:pyrroloquinoline quinone (PQQ) biosynthesis protein C
MAGFYRQLCDFTRERRAELLAVPAIVRGTRGEISLGAYVAFLTEAYHHVKHTVPLLMACGARLPADKEWLRMAIATYIDEETGHQEWILDDIKACGADPEAVRHGRPALATELMVAYAWDTVQRRNPVGLFGMVYVLEGTSVALASSAASAIRDRLGLGPDSCRYLRSHGSLDQGHVEFFAALMERLDDPSDRDDVVHVANVMFRLYGDIYRSLPIH